MRARECREDAGYSIRELAELSEMSHVTIVHLENGKTVPHPKTLRKIAGALGVSVRELRGRPDHVGNAESVLSKEAPNVTPANNNRRHAQAHQPKWATIAVTGMASRRNEPQSSQEGFAMLRATLRLPKTGNVPQELKNRDQWVAWKYEIQDGKPTKVLYTTGNYRASTTDPSTWTTFEKALRHAERNPGKYGVGFVFSSDDPYTGIDLDHCRDPETGEIEPWAKKIVKDINSYSEISPSETGVKIIVKVTLPAFMGSGGKKYLDETKTRAIEIYHHSRFFTITGVAL